jgi:hypothetical protein
VGLCPVHHLPNSYSYSFHTCIVLSAGRVVDVCYLLHSFVQFQNDVLQNKLNEIFSKLSTGLSDGIRPPATPTPGTKQDNDHLRPNNPPAYEVLFPELFVY